VEKIKELALTNTPRTTIKISKNERADWSDKIERSKLYKPKDNERNPYNSEQTNIVTCMQKLYDRGENGQNRHNELMRLVSVSFRQGLSSKGALAYVNGWVKTLEQNEVKKAVEYGYKHGYKYGCKDVIMTQFCDERCIFYKHKNFTEEIISGEKHDDVMLKYSEKRKEDRNKINLKYLLKLHNDYIIYSGEMVVIIGDTGIGKSSLVQNIVINNPHFKWLIFPVENGYELDTRKYLQIANKMTKEEIVNYYNEGKTGLSETISFVNFVTSSVSTKNLRDIIAKSNADIFVIDTLPKVSIDKEDAMKYLGKPAEEIIANVIRDIVVDFGKTIITIHHISKNAAEDKEGKTKKLGVHSTKGSSTVEQLADKVIAIEGDRDGIIREITSLKARDESPFEKIQMKFHKDTFKFT
jgi:hypothetical protein